MCGIAGFLDADISASADEMHSLAQAMAAPLAHRGPDDAGTWCDPPSGIAFGHRRLSVIDLSPLGHQPMISPSGRFVTVFNGEIYNYRELRAELSPGSHLESETDTEVLLAACDQWGVDGALKRANGMFALAIWDTQTREVHLARDRFGEKPLYFGTFGNTLLFASELKALAAHPRFVPELDRASVASFLRYKYVPSPWSIYEGVRKVRPGHAVTFTVAGHQLEVCEHAYWSPREAAGRAAKRQWHGSRLDAADALEEILLRTVALRMHADVPVGAFLSGGIDSSTIVALAQAGRSDPVRTFTVGFEHAGYDEADHALAVARHLGTDHTEVRVTARECLELVPRLADIYDEPFADSSQIPTRVVCEVARRDVTVALSGDGGDELFGGYNRYTWGPRMERLQRLPQRLRQGAGKGLSAIRPGAWDNTLGRAVNRLPAANRMRLVGDRMHKLGRAVAASDEAELYLTLTSDWDPARLVSVPEHPTADLPSGSYTLAEAMMLADTGGYLPDDIMTKLDRASMDVSLEARAPFLDREVFDFTWSLPLDLKIHGGTSRWILRQVLYRHVPSELVERPKMGFDPPVGEWLRGPLRDWAEDLLDRDRLSPIVAPRPVRDLWDAHLDRRVNAQDRLWTVLMLQAWLERWT